MWDERLYSIETASVSAEHRFDLWIQISGLYASSDPNFTSSLISPPVVLLATSVNTSAFILTSNELSANYMNNIWLCFDMKNLIYAGRASTDFANDLIKISTSHGSYAD